MIRAYEEDIAASDTYTLKSQSSTTWTLFHSRIPEAVCTKNDATTIYGVRLRRSLYGWKDNFKELPMELVLGLNSFGVDVNRQNNMTSRICQGAAPPSFGLLARVPCWPKWWTPPWPPPATLGPPLGYKLSSRRLLDSGFV